MDVTRRDLETTKQEPKESFSTFITKWRSKTAQMMNKPSEEEQLTMVVKNLLPVYHTTSICLLSIFLILKL